MRQHAFKFQYGQDEAVSDQLTQIYDAAGNLISEVQDVFVEEDPEMVPLSADVPAKPRRKSDLRRFQTWLMDSNQDDEVTRGEMRVFGLGLVSGYIVSKLFR